MARISVLPSHLVNRIAAGEVIERPASVVKELVENAIDAGASAIEIEVDEGGKKRICVRDDGGGIEPEDLPLAFRSHATSKLAAAEDLDRIGTLGFRGEALASIGSIAEVRIVSRTAGAEAAHAIEVRDGEIGETRPASAPCGTSVEVRTLFFNTPARRKFLRTDATEFSHIAEWATRLALGFEGIGLRLVRDGNEVWRVDRSMDLRARIRVFFGGKIADRLVPVSMDAGWLRIRGCTGLPDLHAPSPRMQHIFVNGRWVRERIALHALREAYKGRQIPGRHPVAFLFLDVEPDRVDVNVHPTKTEVRFRTTEAIHRAVYGAVQRAIAGGDRGPEIEIGSAPRPADAALAQPPPERSRPQPAPSPAPAPDEWVYRPAPRRDEPAVAEVAEVPVVEAVEEVAELPLPDPGEGPPPRGLQVHRAFLVCECEDGIEIIDQHALHERILYEEIRRGRDRREAGEQRLLFPETVELSHALMALLEPVREALAPLGFEIEPFGETVVAIHAIPQGMDPGAAAEAVREAFDAFRASPSLDLEARAERALRLVACKRAVKAGQALTDEEIAYLLARRREAEDPRHCPHGRSASVRLSLRE
ncbi:MAG: DNA mismatch repair endonuclease MutL, partial [Planctomycetes bacterium]|nr:DNA mismatch repair endonuclease MutL [Planctomycetota bacterium]